MYDKLPARQLIGAKGRLFVTARIIRSRLMRILAISQFVAALYTDRDSIRHISAYRAARPHPIRTEISVNRLVVVAALRKCFHRQLAALRQTRIAFGLQRDQYTRIIQRIAEHSYAGEVLGRRAQQRHAADVNLLDRFLDRSHRGRESYR